MKIYFKILKDLSYLLIKLKNNKNKYFFKFNKKIKKKQITIIYLLIKLINFIINKKYQILI